jgi:hypothetical protein
MNKAKLTYETPEIQEVLLDSEISMVLYSEPPGGPGEGSSQQAPFFTDNDW